MVHIVFALQCIKSLKCALEIWMRLGQGGQHERLSIFLLLNWQCEMGQFLGLCLGSLPGMMSVLVCFTGQQGMQQVTSLANAGNALYRALAVFLGVVALTVRPTVVTECDTLYCDFLKQARMRADTVQCTTCGFW